MSEPASSEPPPPPQKELSASDKFFRHFQTSTKEIESQIFDLSSTEQRQRNDAVDNILARIAQLNHEVKDASSYIPAYDQRSYGEAIKTLGVKLAEVRKGLEPKKKFAFKSRGKEQRKENGVEKNGSASTTTSAEVQSPASGALATNGTQGKEDSIRPTSNDPTSLTISNNQNSYIRLPISSTSNLSSATLSNLINCIVNLHSDPNSRTQPAVLKTVTIKNITSSLLLCNEVIGPAHLTNLSNSIVVLASHQTRIHNSHNCDIYLLTPSRPIIEDCSNIRFAPLPKVFMREGEEGRLNLWDQVDDFQWLRKEASPNWKVLPPEHRVKEGAWKEFLTVGEGLWVEQILGRVGLLGASG